MIKIKSNAIELIAIIILTVCISLSSAFIVAFINTDREWTSSLIALFGNIIGGILGGFIALFVARYQIDNSKINEEISEKNEAINLSTVVKEELRNNAIILDALIDSNEMDGHLIKYNLTRESWLFFSSRVAHKLDESLFISLNTVYRKIQIFQSMSIENINEEVEIEQLKTLKGQVSECIRKIEDFKQNLL